MTLLLETKNLTKAYGEEKAIHNVSIQIEQGDIFGLVGRNGAGKTTLMRIIAGLSYPTSGTYEIFKEEKSNQEFLQGRVSSLIENTGIYPNMTAMDHMHMRSLAVGLHDKKEEARILDLVGLGSTGKKSVKKFSLGMKQRLGIAMALIGSPDLVILDEPINGLDPQGIAEFRETILVLNKEENITFLISSHILEELSKLASKFAFIDAGEIVEVIDQESLALKNRDRIIFRSSKLSQALLILDKMDFSDYQVISENEVHIFEGMDATGKIALAMAENEIPIDAIAMHENSLEEYYLNLTGRNRGGQQ